MTSRPPEPASAREPSGAPFLYLQEIVTNPTDKALLDRYCDGYRDGKHGTWPKVGGSRHFIPGLYAILFERLTPVAHAHGYCLAIHGSLARDLDLVAVPWIEAACGPLVLLEAMRARIGGTHGILHPEPTLKPHGRRCWTIHLGGGPYVDVSVMPRVFS